MYGQSMSRPQFRYLEKVGIYFCCAFVPCARALVVCASSRVLAKTNDAALFEMAYYIDNVLLPNGERDGLPGLLDSMVKTRPTRILVWPACPNAFMHPTVKPSRFFVPRVHFLRLSASCSLFVFHYRQHNPVAAADGTKPRFLRTGY